MAQIHLFSSDSADSPQESLSLVVSRLGGSLVVLRGRGDVTALVLILGGLRSLGVLRRRGNVVTLVVVVVLRLGWKLGVLRGRAITTLVLVVLGRRGLAILRRRGDIATLVVVRQVAVSGVLGSGRSLLEVGGALRQC